MCQHTVNVTVVCNCGGGKRSLGERFGEAAAVAALAAMFAGGKALAGIPVTAKARELGRTRGEQVSLAAERCTCAVIVGGGLIAPEAMVAPTLTVAGLAAAAQVTALVWERVTGRPLLGGAETSEVLRISGYRTDRPELTFESVEGQDPLWAFRRDATAER